MSKVNSSLSRKDFFNSKLRKTTIEEEFEHWNVIVLLKRLNGYFRSKLRGTVLKDMQGLEAEDFSMSVLEKVWSGAYSWKDAKSVDFIEWLLNCAKSEARNWIEVNKDRHFESIGTNRKTDQVWDSDAYGGSF